MLTENYGQIVWEVNILNVIGLQNPRPTKNPGKLPCRDFLFAIYVVELFF